MERQNHVKEASSRSGSRKRERSTSPTNTEQFKKPTGKAVRESRQTKRTKSFETVDKSQCKITNYKTKTNMADKSASTSSKGEGEKPKLSEFEQLVLEKLQNLETRMSEIDKKLDERVDKLESRVHNVETLQERQQIDIDGIRKLHSLGEDLMLSNQSVAKASHSQAIANEQYLRNFNIRIFNLPEQEKETTRECEMKLLKVLTLFKEKLQVEVELNQIDVIHRIGKKENIKNSNEPIEQKEINNHTDDSSQNHKTNGTNSNDNVPNVGLNQDGQPADSQIENEAQSNENKSHNKTFSDKNQGQKGARPVIVSFISRRIRREILENRHKLKKKSLKDIPIIIVEDLSQPNYSLLMKARDSEKYSSTWSREGAIYGKQAINGLILQIKSTADIESPAITRPPDTHSRRHYTRGRGQQISRGVSRGGGRGSRRGHPAGHSQRRGDDRLSPGGSIQQKGPTTYNHFQPLETNSMNGSQEQSDMEESDVNIFD